MPCNDRPGGEILCESAFLVTMLTRGGGHFAEMLIVANGGGGKGERVNLPTSQMDGPYANLICHFFKVFNKPIKF